MSNNFIEDKPPAVAKRDGDAVRPPAPPPRRRGTRRVSLTITAFAIVGIIGFVWWLNHARGPGNGRDNRRAFWRTDTMPVVVQAAEPGDIEIYRNGLGTVVPLANIVVRARISGQLTEVKFQEGQMVKEGELLAVIDPRPYTVALEEAQGELLQAQAQLKQAQSDLERFDVLVKQGSISVQQLDAQRALVSRYQALVKTDEAAVDSAQLNLTYCHVTAPLTGRVGLRQVDPGNYVTAGDASGLVVLTQVRPISVIFTLPERDSRRVMQRFRAGAKLEVDAFDSTQTQQLAEGELSAIDNQADPSTGTFKLRAIFPNTDEALFPNEFVNVRMLLEVEKDALVIPSSAIERGQEGTFVYVVGNDNVAKARTVTLGPSQNERIAVLNGLVAGERVVSDGADRLRDGMNVTIQTAGGHDVASPRRPEALRPAIRDGALRCNTHAGRGGPAYAR